MANHPAQPTPQPIGDALRQKRIEVLGKGLREMAAILDITPAHLTDIEKGRRTPSEALLTRISEQYQVDAATLHSGWKKLDEGAKRIITKNPTTAEKAPALLRAAEELSSDQWDALIRRAKQLAKESRGKKK